MTFFFGILYLQYHMSRIAHWKKTGDVVHVGTVSIGKPKKPCSPSRAFLFGLPNNDAGFSVCLSCGGDFGFGFGDHAECLIVGFFAFAGFAPHLLAAFALLLGAGHVDLLGLESVGGEDRDAIGQDFNESPTDVVAVELSGQAGSRPVPGGCGRRRRRTRPSAARARRALRSSRTSRAARPPMPRSRRECARE